MGVLLRHPFLLNRGDRILNPTILFQTTLNGLMIGGVYALVAVGLTLIFGVMKIVNFAQGEFVMLGMYVSWMLATFARVGPYPGLLIVGAVMFALGYLTFKLLIIRVIGRPDEAFILLTLGLSIVLQNLVLVIFGAEYFSVDTPVKDEAFHVAGLSLSVPRLIAFVVALLLVIGLTLLLNKTDLGRAMRATAESREVATLLGINPIRCFTIAFAIGIVLAGTAGVLLTPMFYVFPGVGTLFNLTAFVVVVLGGMGSVTGALLGGLIIGIVEALSSTYISLDLSQLFTFLIFLAVLFFRPSGLFGGATQ
jgi:branched-chain amino acid transport system permease protein